MKLDINLPRLPELTDKQDKRFREWIKTEFTAACQTPLKPPSPRYIRTGDWGQYLKPSIGARNHDK